MKLLFVLVPLLVVCLAQRTKEQETDVSYICGGEFGRNASMVHLHCFCHSAECELSGAVSYFLTKACRFQFRPRVNLGRTAQALEEVSAEKLARISAITHAMPKIN